jgi:hypothetical protein
MEVTVNILEPLRLAVGSHQAGSGKGCAMNVISWENGDAEITDYPECSDPLLASIVQRVNDTLCRHRDGKLLCAPCSTKVLDLAHRTVGTSLAEWGAKERCDVYVAIAGSEAASPTGFVISMLSATEYHIMALNAAAERNVPAASDAAYAAFATAVIPTQRLERAHQLIDYFEYLTGVRAVQPDEQAKSVAIQNMLATA